VKETVKQIVKQMGDMVKKLDVTNV